MGKEGESMKDESTLRTVIDKEIALNLSRENKWEAYENVKKAMRRFEIAVGERITPTEWVYQIGYIAKQLNL